MSAARDSPAGQWESSGRALEGVGGAAGRAWGSPGVPRGAAGRTRRSARRAPTLAGGGAAAAAAALPPGPARPSPGSGEEMT